MRIACQAAFLDAGGVIVLPHRDLVAGALGRVGIEIEPSTVAPAHYEAVRRLDAGATGGWVREFCRGLGVAHARMGAAIDALERLSDRPRSGEILWSEPAPRAQAMIEALRRAGIEVIVVSNSDGHAAENLRDARIFRGVVVDSGLVGHAKPHPAIFRVALERAGAEPGATVHVGDTIASDVRGASAAGIVPIHFDPGRRCRDAEHRHVRSLDGLWQHVRAAGP